MGELNNMVAESRYGHAYVEGQYWVSPLNHDPEVQRAYDFPWPLTVFDSTVRKILLTPGLRPTVDDLLRVSEAIEDVGIREVFLNIHWWGDPEPDALDYQSTRAILARNFAFNATVYAELLMATDGSGSYSANPLQAVEEMKEIGAKAIQVQARLQRDLAAQSDRLGEVFSIAHELGISCSLGLADVGRVDFERIVQFANEGIRLGATRIDLLDSNSSMSPEAMKLFIHRFKSRLAVGLPITMHVHDDFGLGTATVISAACAGANPDVSVNGLSYRTGFAALEEVALSLELLYGVPTGLRLDRLNKVCDLVAQCTGLSNHPLKPVVGSHAFLRDTVDAMAQYFKAGPHGFPPPSSCFAPALVGGRMEPVWGIHYSNGAIRAKLSQMNLPAEEDTVAEIRRQIRARVEALEQYPYWIADEEVETICRRVLSG